MFSNIIININNDSLSFRVLKLQIQREMKEKKEQMNTESFIIKKCYSIQVNDHGMVNPQLIWASLCSKRSVSNISITAQLFKKIAQFYSVRPREVKY